MILKMELEKAEEEEEERERYWSMGWMEDKE